MRQLSHPLTLALFFLLPTLLRAQSVAVTFNIIPPYSAYVYDYADLNGRAVITLTNLTAQPIDARLEGILANTTNGLFVRTNPGHRGPLPISLPPNGTVVLSTQPGVMDFLDPQVVTTNATQQDEQAIVQTGQLPEGIYRFCVEVYDYNGPQLLSVPNAGCTTFNLQYANPPLIVQPVNMQELSPFLQNPVFTWTPPLGNLAGAMIQYELVVAPVFPGQDPNDAIIAARTYRRAQPVLVKQGLMNTVYVRQPSDLPFEQGKQYAMQVTARDLNNSVAIANVGRSEISVFSVGERPTLPPIFVGGGTPITPIIDPGIPPSFTANHLSGKLRYYWPQPGSYAEPFIPSAEQFSSVAGSTSSGSGSIPGLQGINPAALNNAVGGGTSGPQQMGPGGVGIAGNTVRNVPVVYAAIDAEQHQHNIVGGNRAGYGQLQQSPLPAVTVQLVQAIQLKGQVTVHPGASQTPLLPSNILVPGTVFYTAQNQAVQLPVLATTTTGPDGSFHFNVPNMGAIDFSWQNGSVNVNNTYGGEFSGNVNCEGWRRVLMVRIDQGANTYYTQPAQFNAGIPANRDLGLFHARVKTYSTTVKVAESLNAAVHKPGMEVLLMRKVNTRPARAPIDELAPGNFLPREEIVIAGSRYTILAKAVTNSNGEAPFHNLVRFSLAHEGPNVYYTFARPEDAHFTQHSLHSIARMVQYAHKPNWTTNCLSCGFVSGYCTQIPASCGPSYLQHHGSNSYGVLDDAHAAAYKPAPTGLYHIHGVGRSRPSITATVKNGGAGTQADLALNEPGATCAVYRIDKATMNILKTFIPDARWGAMLETDPADRFFTQANYCQSVGRAFFLERLGVTGPDGRIRETELPTHGMQNGSNSDQFFRAVVVTKNGFTPVVRMVNGTTTVNNLTGDVGPNEMGNNYFLGELWLQPRGQVKLTLRNEDGVPVAGSAYYYDPQTGQQGTIGSTVNFPGVVLNTITLAVPSGTGRRIAIVPQNTNLYDRDTIIVNVPATGVHNVDVTVPWKLHRIHFHVEKNIPLALQNRIADARVELVNTNAVMYPDVKHPETDFEGAMAQGAQPDAGFNSGQPGGGSSTPSMPGSGIQRPSASALAGALNTVNPYVRRTNAAGAVDFAFRASGGTSTFTFRFYSPEGEEYVTLEDEFTSTPGKQWQKITVKMDEGRRVQGQVTLDSALVAGAKVRYVHEGITNEATTDAQGNYVLRRVPKDVALTFHCSKQGYAGMEFTEGQGVQNLFGQVTHANLPSGQGSAGPTVTTINFRLKVYGGMDFHRLLGFPLEVTALTELPGARVRINGWVSVPDSANAVFRMSAANSEGGRLDVVRISNITLEPDATQLNAETVPLATPQVLPVPLAVNHMPVGMYHRPGAQPYTYHGELHDTQQGITIGRSNSDARGMVQGRVHVGVGSFSDNNFALQDAEQFALMDPVEQQQMRIPVFTSNAQSYHPADLGMRVVGTNGAPLTYLLHGFQANSISSGSRLYRDSLVLDTRLRTALQHVPAPQNDLNLAIGTITLKNGSLQPFTGERTFTIALGQFQFNGDHLSMNSGGFAFKGTLNANGLTLPVTNGRLYPTSFSLGSMSVANMKLIDAVPVTAHRPAVFGYDAVRPAPAWYVAVTSGDHNTAGLSISGQYLDGIPNDRSVDLSSLWLYSNGDQEASLMHGNAPYVLHDVVSVSLQQVLLSASLLTFPTALELGMPGFPAYTTALVYDKQGDGVGPMKLQPFNMQPVAVNGIQMAFDKQQVPAMVNVAGDSHCIVFSPGRVTIKGVISDQDPNVFKNLRYTLTKTTSDTRLVVDRSPQQSVRLGGDNPGSRILMTDVEGEMWVQGQGLNASWNHFYLKGNMPEEMGFEPTAQGPQRMRFEVRGDLAVESQQIKLKDIETPFGNINMVYDPMHHRLSGQMNVAHSVSGGPSMNGSVAIVLDREGYYFMTGLNVQLSNPEMQGMAFLLLGDYARRTVEMDAMLLQYSLYAHRMIERKNSPVMLQMVLPMLASMPEVGVGLAQGVTGGEALPVAYTALFGSGRFNGFFIECGASIPFPLLPNFSIDCSPIAHVYFGVNMGADVRLGANFGSGTYTVGFDTFMDAAMGGAASMGTFCFAGRIGVYFTIGMNGVFHTNGNWNVQATGNLDLKGSFRIGGGMCPSACEGMTCLHVSVDGNIGMGMVGNFSNSGNDFRIIMGSDNTTSSVHEPPPDTEN